MNKEDAKALLEAWDFLKKNPAGQWEGISLKELERTLERATGETNPILIREYLSNIIARQDQLSETVPQKLVEAAKEGKISEKEVERSKNTTSAIKAWIARRKAQNAEEIAEKEVAIAQLKTLSQEELKKETPSSETPTPASFETGAAGGAGADGGLAAAAGMAVSTVAATTAPRILKVEVPVSVEKSLKNRINKTRDEIMFLPFRAAAAVAGPALAKENPELATATTLVARGFATSMGAYALEQSALASGASPSQIKKLFSEMQNLPAPLAMRLASGLGGWPDFSYAAYLDKSFSAAELGAFLPSRDGSSIVLAPESFVGGIFQQIGTRLFGRAAAGALKGILGGAGKAAVAAGAEAAAGAAAGGAAGAATGAAAGAATGAAVGAAGGPTAIVTAAIGAIVGYLKGKIPDIVSWLKRHAKDFGAAALALFVGGVFLGNSALIISGGGLGALALAGGGTGAIGAGAKSMLQTLFWGLTVLVLPSIAAPLIIAFVSLPIMLALIFFIINSSAFLMPKQVNVSAPITLPFSLTGALPAGVPTTWPVSGGYVVQGPNNSRYTHAAAQAVDIILPVGTPIGSTTEGVAKVLNFYPYGKHVEIQSQAGGVSFAVRYAHMSAISITDGQTVSVGQTIGLSGNTGLSSEPHLHYEFLGLPMTNPLIPTPNSLESCWGSNECNFTLP